MVGMAGFEPARPGGLLLLRQARLPVPPRADNMVRSAGVEPAMPLLAPAPEAGVSAVFPPRPERWCLERDSNPQGLSPTAISRQRVYQLRHPGMKYGADTPIRTKDPLLTKQPLLTAELCRQGSGADSPDRTDGLPLTKGLLCHLSYIGITMVLRVGIEPTAAPIPRACATNCAIEALTLAPRAGIEPAASPWTGEHSGL